MLLTCISSSCLQLQDLRQTNVPVLLLALSCSWCNPPDCPGLVCTLPCRPFTAFSLQWQDQRRPQRACRCATQPCSTLLQQRAWPASSAVLTLQKQPHVWR